MASSVQTQPHAPSSTPELEHRFRRLAEQWREETRATSSLSRLVMHPAYQQIIGMGAPAVPLIVRELRERPNHWFWALFSILGVNPVPPEDAGDLERMTELWLAYLRQHHPELVPPS